jgi:hypothetical protein
VTGLSTCCETGSIDRGTVGTKVIIFKPADPEAKGLVERLPARLPHRLSSPFACGGGECGIRLPPRAHSLMIATRLGSAFVASLIGVRTSRMPSR